MKTLTLKPQFVDRAGRVVYQICSDGTDTLGMIRLHPTDDTRPTMLEWIVPAPDEFVPGRLPEVDEPGPHAGGSDG